jgi:hypothetical protein
MGIVKLSSMGRFTESATVVSKIAENPITYSAGWYKYFGAIETIIIPTKKNVNEPKYDLLGANCFLAKYLPTSAEMLSESERTSMPVIAINLGKRIIHKTSAIRSHEAPVILIIFLSYSWLRNRFPKIL